MILIQILILKITKLTDLSKSFDYPLISLVFHTWLFQIVSFYTAYWRSKGDSNNKQNIYVGAASIFSLDVDYAESSSFVFRCGKFLSKHFNLLNLNIIECIARKNYYLLLLIALGFWRKTIFEPLRFAISKIKIRFTRGSNQLNENKTFGVFICVYIYLSHLHLFWDISTKINMNFTHYRAKFQSCHNVNSIIFLIFNNSVYFF